MNHLLIVYVLIKMEIKMFISLKKSYFIFLIINFVLNSLMLNSVYAQKPNRPVAKAEKREIKKETIAQRDAANSEKEEIKEMTRNNPFQIINNVIDYSGYQKPKNYFNSYICDVLKFEKGAKNIRGTTKKPYTVLVQFNEGNQLNLRSSYVPKTRTLTWGVPLEIALNQAQSTAAHAHNQSALLTNWSGGNLREFITFIIFPQGTALEFLIGPAAPQEDSTEFRPGQGTQIRLKFIPAGTIVLTQDLAKYQKGNKETFDMTRILNDLLEKYNSSPNNVVQIDLNELIDLRHGLLEGDYDSYIKYFFSNVSYLKSNQITPEAVATPDTCDPWGPFYN